VSLGGAKGIVSSTSNYHVNSIDPTLFVQTVPESIEIVLAWLKEKVLVSGHKFRYTGFISGSCDIAWWNLHLMIQFIP
jgi:hypothetical protein